MTWATNSTAAMQQHYDTFIKATEDFIQSFVIPEAFLDRSLDLASRWARNQLRRKLRDDTLDAALTRIRQLQAFCETPAAPSLENHQKTSAVVPPMTCSTTSTRPSRVDATTQSSTPWAFTTVAPPEPTAASPPDVQTLDHSEDPVHATRIAPPAAPAAAVAVVEATSELIPLASSPETSSDPTSSSQQPLIRTQPSSQEPTANFTAPQGPHSQLDLFGSIVEETNQPERQSIQALPEADAWSPRVVLGDDNLRTFSHPDTTVISRPKGRLSHLHRLFCKYEHGPIMHVNTLIICLSTLDKRNTHSTNISSLKSLLGTVKKVFPCAKTSLLACGIDDSFSIEERLSCSSINNFIRNKAPSSSVHIPTADPFTCHNDVWSDSTKSSIYNILKNYLN